MIILDRSSSVPLYRQLHDRIAEAILKGDVPVGHRLAPMRKRATELGVSRNTVEQAYRQLVSEGYVTALQGSGFIVNRREKQPQPPDEMSEDYREGQHRLRERLRNEHATRPCRYDFNYGNLDPSTFPVSTWARLSRDVLYGSMANRAYRYDDRQGLAELRAETIRYLSNESGVQAIPEQVVFMPGTQSALETILLLFDPQRDSVMMDDPGFPIARNTFLERGFEVVTYAADDRGASFNRRAGRKKNRLVFVTPSAQFPTNAIMPLKARQILLDWAETNDAYIIEDDYCREFHYNVDPVPSLQSLDRDGRVIHLGTASKTFNPALRLSYIVFPPHLMERWLDVTHDTFQQVPWQTQATLAAYMSEGAWDDHLNLMKTLALRKRNLLLRSLKDIVGDKIEIGNSSAGLHLLVRVPDGRSEGELIEAAARAGVRVYPTHQYWRNPAQAPVGLVLVGYSSIFVEDIEPGIAALARAWFE